ncbi:hypothetical protein IFR05_015473 [Cadophora sp. M221]|nr:hypothetical protein IFR05_015473 [Cadophora sp. M221]
MVQTPKSSTPSFTPNMGYSAIDVIATATRKISIWQDASSAAVKKQAGQGRPTSCYTCSGIAAKSTPFCPPCREETKAELKANTASATKLRMETESALRFFNAPRENKVLVRQVKLSDGFVLREEYHTT